MGMGHIDGKLNREHAGRDTGEHQICRHADSYTLLNREARDGESVLSHMWLQAGDLTYLE